MPERARILCSELEIKQAGLENAYLLLVVSRGLFLDSVIFSFYISNVYKPVKGTPHPPEEQKKSVYKISTND